VSLELATIVRAEGGSLVFGNSQQPKALRTWGIRDGSSGEDIERSVVPMGFMVSVNAAWSSMSKPFT